MAKRHGVDLSRSFLSSTIDANRSATVVTERQIADSCWRHFSRLPEDSRREALAMDEMALALVRRYSGAGKRLFELKVDGGQVIEKGADGKGPWPKGTRALTATTILRGLAEGRDGSLYLAVSPKGDGAVVLDRYDLARSGHLLDCRHFTAAHRLVLKPKARSDLRTHFCFRSP